MQQCSHFHPERVENEDSFERDTHVTDAGAVADAFALTVSVEVTDLS